MPNDSLTNLPLDTVLATYEAIWCGDIPHLRSAARMAACGLVACTSDFGGVWYVTSEGALHRQECKRVQRALEDSAEG